MSEILRDTAWKSSCESYC